MLKLKSAASLSRNGGYHLAKPANVSWRFRCAAYCNQNASIKRLFQQQMQQFEGISPIQHQKYIEYFHPESRSKRFRRYLGIAAFVLSATCGVLYYIYWPRHTFSSSVAKVLRKALWAELKKENYNYKKALMLYMEALEVMKQENQESKEKMDNSNELENITLDDEYTGIEIKIGEMLEKLGDHKKARQLYYEMSDRYDEALKSCNSKKLRRHYVQKKLRLVTKICQLSEKDTSKDYLRLLCYTNLVMAQNEVLKQMNGLSYEKQNVFDPQSEADKLFLVTDLFNKSVSKMPKLLISVTEDGEYQTRFSVPGDDKSKQIEEIFGDIRDEFFNLRNLYVSICTSYRESSRAIWQSCTDIQVSTTNWMISAGCDVTELMDALNQCGSLLYMNAEYMEYLSSKNTSDANTEDQKQLAQFDFESQKNKFLNSSLSYYTTVYKLYQSIPESPAIPFKYSIQSWFFKKKKLIPIKDLPHVLNCVALSLYSTGIIYMKLATDSNDGTDVRTYLKNAKQVFDRARHIGQQNPELLAALREEELKIKDIAESKSILN